MSNRQNALKMTLAVVALTMFGTACKSKLTGNKGNFVFSYVATDSIRDFNKPIAVGAKLDLKVDTTGAIGRAVDIQEASTDASDVLSVESFSGNTIVLLGTGSGQALVSVTAKTPNGQVLDDEVNMQARVPERLKLNHSCTTDEEARYLVNQAVWLHFDMEMDNGQPVIGYGYHPVTLTPADSLTIDQTSKAQEFIEMAAGSATGSVTVASDIDDTELTIVLIEPSLIDGARLDEAGTRTPVLVDRTRWLHVTPLVGEAPICQANTQMQLTNDTPDLCEVSSGHTSDELGAASDSLEQWGIVKVKGLAPGACKFTVWHPAAGDAPAETQMEIVIGEIDTGDADAG